MTAGLTPHGAPQDGGVERWGCRANAGWAAQGRAARGAGQTRRRLGNDSACGCRCIPRLPPPAAQQPVSPKGKGDTERPEQGAEAMRGAGTEARAWKGAETWSLRALPTEWPRLFLRSRDSLCGVASGDGVLLLKPPKAPPVPAGEPLAFGLQCPLPKAYRLGVALKTGY